MDAKNGHRVLHETPVAMKRLKIGYFPLSKNLSAPGDRRRLVFWARKRGHELVLNTYRGVDLIFLTEGCNFSNLKKVTQVPKVFDLVDSYLIRTSLFGDYIRGFIKGVAKQQNSYFKAFSDLVRETVVSMDAIVCSSPEQANSIRALNSNVYDILDVHSEIPELEDCLSLRRTKKSLFWEGSPHTFGPLVKLMSELDLEEYRTLIAVSDEFRYRIMNKYFKQDMSRVYNNRVSNIELQLVPWSVSGLVKSSRESRLALIPVKMGSNFHESKPENRLMIMFRLGIPVVASSTPSHKRIQSALGINFTASTSREWAAQIKEFSHNEDLREHFRSQSKSYISMHHNEEHLLSKWDQVFQSII